MKSPRTAANTSAAEGIISLQEKPGWITQDKFPVYREKWAQIREFLADSPTPEQVLTMLTDIGLPFADFETMYTAEKRLDGVRFAKDLKDRYTVLWLYEQVK